VSEARLSYIIVAMALPTTDWRREVRRWVRRLHLRTVCKIVVSVCLLWHIYAVAMWNLPNTTPLITPRISDDSVVRKYMVASGFMQGWGMFAPDPYSLDVYVEAQIHYADGTTRSWEFPRMAKMSTWEKYGKERWRKYTEVAHQDAYSFLWPVMAHYAARENNLYPGNPPVSVALVRHFRLVRAPDQEPGAFAAYQFTMVDIKPEDLH